MKNCWFFFSLDICGYLYFDFYTLLKLEIHFGKWHQLVRCSVCTACASSEQNRRQEIEYNKKGEIGFSYFFGGV